MEPWNEMLWALGFLSISYFISLSCHSPGLAARASACTAGTKHEQNLFR